MKRARNITVTIKEDFQIPGTNVVLEAGDKIRIMEAKLSPQIEREMEIAFQRMSSGVDFRQYLDDVMEQDIWYEWAMEKGYEDLLFNEDGEPLPSTLEKMNSLEMAKYGKTVEDEV